MEFGGIFILVVLLIVLGVLGGGLYAVAMWLRGRKLDPRGDMVDGREREQLPPEHTTVDTEQRTRFAGTR